MLNHGYQRRCVGVPPPARAGDEEKRVQAGALRKLTCERAGELSQCSSCRVEDAFSHSQSMQWPTVPLSTSLLSTHKPTEVLTHGAFLANLLQLDTDNVSDAARVQLETYAAAYDLEVTAASCTLGG